MHRKNVKSAKLEELLSQISANGKVLDTVTSHISGLIACLRPYHRTLQLYQQSRRSETWRLKRLRKQLVEALKLSKLNFNDFVLYPLSQYLEAKLQRVQKIAPQVFVVVVFNNRYAKMADVIELGRLPVSYFYLSQSIRQLVPEYVLQKLQTSVSMIAFIFKQLTAVNTLASSVLKSNDSLSSNVLFHTSLVIVMLTFCNIQWPPVFTKRKGEGGGGEEEEEMSIGKCIQRHKTCKTF